MKTIWIEDEDALNIGRVIVTKTGTHDCTVCYSCDEREAIKHIDKVLEVVERYKLRIPPTVYDELVSDIMNMEEEE